MLILRQKTTGRMGELDLLIPLKTIMTLSGRWILAYPRTSKKGVPELFDAAVEYGDSNP